MASCSSVNTFGKQISVENKDTNSSQRENFDLTVAFSLRIPLSMFLKWKEHDPNLIVPLVKKTAWCEIRGVLCQSSPKVKEKDIQSLGFN